MTDVVCVIKKRRGEKKMKPFKKREFGKTAEGVQAYLYTMTNDAGMSASVTDFGATLVHLEVPDKEGKTKDVVLGYDDALGYQQGDCFFGATVGRNANRIGGASLEISGVLYQLDQNDNGNNLHSGWNYYNKRFWNVVERGDDHITFLLHSEDGDQGYPGAVDVKVTYELTEENTIRLTYDAVPDKDTLLNMTNHSYFNLNGHDSGDVLGHIVTLDADSFTRADAESIPTGEYTDVTGTPMDFRQGRVIGQDIDADYEAIRFGQGYDHNWVLKNNGKFVKVAKAVAPESGIVMEVSTDLPGVQIYTGNFLNGVAGKKNAVYNRRASICFETQYFPDAVHHENFPSPICKAGETYHTVTAYHFTTTD